MKYLKGILLFLCFYLIQTESFGQTITRGPYLQSGTTSSMVVRWRTNTATNSKVWYGNSPTNLNNTVVESNNTTEHEVLVPNLSASTTYYYAVGNNAGQLAGADNNHYFITSPTTGSTPTIRAWVLGDAGKASDEQRAVRDGFYNYIGSSHIDMILQLGDNAYENGTDAEYQVAWFQNMYEDRLINSVLWPNPGNHDLGATADSPTQTGPYYDIFTMPKNGEAGGVPSGTEAYYSMDYGNLHVISLDSDDTDLDPGSPMLTWVQNDLNATNQDWIVVLFHHPPYAGDTRLDAGAKEQKMRENFLPVLEAGGVDLVLVGHHHVYERSFLIKGHYGFSTTFDPNTMALDMGDGKIDGDGAYQKLIGGNASNEGTIYCISGNAGALGNPDPPYHPVMEYHYPGNKGSSYIKISGLQLDFKLIDEFGNVADYFTIVKQVVSGTPPTVDIIEPTDNRFYPTPQTITIEAAAADQGGQVTQVEFFVDDVSIGTDNTPSQGIYTFDWTIPANGEYKIHAEVTDNDNNVIASLKETIQVGPITICTKVLGKKNDAEERTGGVINVTNKDLELVNDGSNGDQVVGLRFENLEIPQGAAIISSDIQFTVGGTSNIDPINLNLRGEANDVPLLFSSTINNISSRPLTNASVQWFPPNWNTNGASGPDQKTPDLTPIIQEVVNRPGFSPASPIAIIIQGAGRREAASYDDNPSVSAELCITYSPFCISGDNDGDGICADQDCDDNDPNVHALDCNGVCGGLVIDNDGDGACSDIDCDDNDPFINPGATEVCDGIDNNCDGNIDEGFTPITYYADADGDGFGNPNVTISDCTPPFGYVTDNTDCNDSNANIYPAAPELCDGLDNDCDGNIDEDIEICDGIDNDCDGFIDEGVCLGGTLQIPIDSGDDDVEQVNSSGSIRSTSSDLEISEAGTNIQTVGLRFNNVTVPQGGVILNAYIQFVADEVQTGPASATVWGEDTDNASPFTGINFDVSNRTTTSAAVSWNNIPPWSTVGDAGPNEQTPSLISIVQEIVNRGGWLPGNSMVFILTGTGTRTADSYNANPNKAPVLHIEYDNPTCPPGQFTVNASGNDVSCGGTNNGSATATPSGGAGTITYNWTGPNGYSASSATINNLAPGVYAIEVIDGNGCIANDNVTISDPNNIYYADTDSDGYGDPNNTTLACSLPAGYSTDNTDCNDSNAAVNPGATEICDGIDNNCDGNIDEGAPNTYYADTDGDGYGDPNNTTQGCSPPAGFVSDNTDCNDGNPSVNPGATEVCDGIDNNCDGNIDEGVQNTYYADTDGDGYGDPGSTTQACSPPAGFVSDNTDCNDGNSAANPGAAEICDGIDNNCDGNIDEGLNNTYYADSDGDGYGDPNTSTQACSQPAGYVTDNTDCNDNNAAANPGATEICDGIDNNCDGNVDEGLLTTYYPDTDGDGYGDPNTSTQACSQPAGFVTDNTDCNDNNAAANPGATEICDGIDNNCDGNIDEGGTNIFYADTDGDGYGDPNTTTLGCSPPAGFVADNTDCNDNDPAINPGAAEVCDGIDNNCDGNIDDGGQSTYYADSDGDGFGNPNNSTVDCAPPAGFVLDNTDCNDNDPTVYPGATEICDGVDNNCDGNIDEGVSNTYYADIDGDGYGDPGSFILACAPKPGYVTDNTDCNDADPAVNPGATEVCDGIDNNCDGNIDEGLSNTYYADTDGDGYGDPNTSTQACSQPAGFVTDNTDCNDNSAAANPGATEICDGIDNNCDGNIDEGLSNTYYADTDGDGYGDPNTSTQACSQPAGFVTDNTDCNDNSAAVNPGATEICDGIDNNCDGNIDEGLLNTYYADTDGDGYGDPNSSTQACSPPAGFVTDNTDCNDGSSAANPGAAEICDGIDNNCDGNIDEGLVGCNEDPITSCSRISSSTDDAEERTSGSLSLTSSDLELVNDGTRGDQIIGMRFLNLNIPQGATITEAYIQFGADETTGVDPCNLTIYGQDSDNPATFANTSLNISSRPLTSASSVWSPPLWTNTGDAGPDQQTVNIAAIIQEIVNRPGYSASSSIVIIIQGTGKRTAESFNGNSLLAPELCVTYDPNCVDNDGDGACASVDCNDNNPAINPSATEICDGIDNNCDGNIDEGGPNTYYADTDSDGYGDANNTIQGCTVPAGYVTNNTDCNDADAAINPGATEICDTVDNNCDGNVNEGLSGCNPTPTTSCSRINSSTDDAEERSTGRVSLTSSDLELVNDGTKGDQVIGMRFIDLNIPQGAVISSAYIQFAADETTAIDPCNLTIYGQATDDAGTFIGNDFDVSARTPTNASVAWSPPTWTSRGDAGPAQQTVDISTIIQEIVSRPGFSASSAIAIIIQGTGKRTAESFNGSPTTAPELCVTYDVVSQSQRLENIPNTIETTLTPLNQESDRKFNVTVNPNPFQQELWILVQKPNIDIKRSTVTIMDIYGRTIYLDSEVTFDEQIPISLSSSLPKGVYLIRVQVDQYLKTIKVVKQ